MKLNRVFSLVIVIALMLALVPAASAQGPAGTWVSGIACQNLDELNQALITLHFYPEGSGTTALDYDATIAAGGSVNFYTPSSPPGLPEQFLGSVMVESSTPLACTINTQTTGGGTAANPFRMATASGFADNETGLTMYAPQVMKLFTGTWSSYIAVQNATANEVSVTVSYKNRYGVPVAANETGTIPGYSNKVFYQEDNANLPDGFLGAATVTANGNIAVVTNFYNAGTTSSNSQFQSYDGFADGSTKLLVPRFVRRFYGYNGGMAIQNLGSNPTTVAMAFTYDGTTYNFTSPTIQPNAAYFIYATDIPVLSPVDSLPMSKRFGSVVLTSSEKIIAIVNEDNRGLTADNNGNPIEVERISQGATYNAFPDGVQTDTIFFSQVTAGANAKFSGGFQVANTTNTPATCTATFNKQAGLTFDFSLDGFGSKSVYAPNVPGMVQPYNGSVTIECSQPVVGIMNLAAILGTGLVGDSSTCANGLNR